MQFNALQIVGGGLGVFKPALLASYRGGVNTSHHLAGTQLTAAVYRRLVFYPYFFQRWIIDVVLALEAKGMAAP